MALGATILLLVTMFHLSAFLSGYFLTGSVFRNAPDSKTLQRTLSYETGNKLKLTLWFYYDLVLKVLRREMSILNSQECRVVFWL